MKKNAGGMKGPGWLKAERPGDAQARPVEATWQRELEFGPYEGVQCAKLAGDAQVDSPGVGLLKAETIRLFMIEDPTTPPTDTGRRPPCARSVTGLRARTFRIADANRRRSSFASLAAPPTAEPRSASVARGAAAVASPKRPGVAQATPVAASTNPLSPAAAPTPDGRQIHVAGELLQVEALLGDKSTEVRAFTSSETWCSAS